MESTFYRILLKMNDRGDQGRNLFKKFIIPEKLPLTRLSILHLITNKMNNVE